MSQDKFKWLRNEDINRDIADAFNDMQHNNTLTVVLEDLCVKVWNKAIKEAKDKADESDIYEDPAKEIAKLEVDP